MPKLLCSRGSAPDSAGELKRSSDRLTSCNIGPTSKGCRGEESKKREGRGGKGKEGREREGRDTAWPDLQFSLCDVTDTEREHRKI